MIERGVTRHFCPERALQGPGTGAVFYPAQKSLRRQGFYLALYSGAASVRIGRSHPNGDGEIRGLDLQHSAGFTLLEVMIAVAFIGIAMLALLSLHRSDLLSVARARDMTRAAMLAQSMMADAEMARFPMPGQLSGDFQKMYPGQYPNFRWQRKVEQSHEFPDICRVRITVFYGPRFRRTFVLTEFMHSPVPQINPSSSAGDGQDPNGSPSGQSGNIAP
jgi:general secretion pathway protein I